MVASPTFYGTLEDLAALGRARARTPARCWSSARNPILLGVMEPPAAYGADIVVAEGQPLGSPMSFGGPGLGRLRVPTGAHAPDARSRRRPHHRRGRQDRFRAHVLHARAAHPSREGDLEHLLQPCAQRACGRRLPRGGRRARASRGSPKRASPRRTICEAALVATGRFERVVRRRRSATSSRCATAVTWPRCSARSLERGFLAGLDLAVFSPTTPGLVLVRRDREAHACRDSTGSWRR